MTASRHASAHVTLSLLGSLQATLATGAAVRLPTKKTQALLVYLAIPAGRAHEREKLAALLWGDTSDAQALNSLRHTLVGLRKALAGAPAPPLLGERRTLALNPAAVDVDVVAFQRKIDEGTPAALEEAVALYRGDLLEGFVVREALFDDWLLAERERLRELALDALGRLLAHHHATPASETAIRIAARLLALDPLREDVHRTLMGLYARQGRRGAALRQYQVCVGVLRRRLRVEPEAETKRLYRDLLQRSPADAAWAMHAGEASGRASPTARPTDGDRSTAPADAALLIGREPELAALVQALDDTWAGHGHVALVLGEAGIGKSRMLEAVAEEARRRGARVLVGHAFESEGMLAFGPWVDLLRRIGLVADAAVLDRLEPAWRTELAHLLPELGRKLDGPAAPADLRRLFEAVSRLLMALAADGPIVVLLEDAHWADEMSVRLLAFLGRRIRAMPVLVGVTAREEELTTTPVLGPVLDELGRERHVIRLALGRLSEAQTAELVLALGRAPGAGDSVMAQVWAASEGNPFVAIETLRACEEGGAPEVPARIAVPESVRNMIRDRVKRLGRHARVLAEIAAVVGRDVDWALLRDAAGVSEGAAAEGLEELVSRRMLRLTGDEFAFAHDRIREVVYDDVLPPRRTVLHGQVAEALESLHAGELAPHYTALGRHYREGQVWDRAVHYLDQAGIQAASRSAHGEAVMCFEGALEALAHLPEAPETLQQAVDIRLRLRNSLAPLGRNDEIRERLGEAERIAEAADDQHRLNRVTCSMIHFLCTIGEYETAIGVGRRAAQFAEAVGDIATQAEAHFFVGAASFSLGEYAQAEDALTRGLTVAERAGKFERFGLSFLPAAACRCWLAWALAERGAFAEALKRAREIEGIARALDHRWTRLEARFALGVVYVRQGDHAAAIAELEPALKDAEAAQAALILPSIAAQLGYAYALAGRADAAVRTLLRALEEGEAIRVVAHRSRWLGMLGEACLRAGRLDDADAHARRALDLARAHHERGHEAWSLRLLGEIDAHREPPEVTRAEGHCRHALTLASALGMRPLVAHCHLALGRLQARAGDRGRAAEDLGVAATMYREMDMRFCLDEAGRDHVSDK